MNPYGRGHIYTVAGNGTGFSGDGGLPLRAEITDPIGVSVDGAGDVAVTATADFAAGELFDTTVDLIAAGPGTVFGRPLTTGRLYRLAGNGIRGFGGDKGPARIAAVNATLNDPAGTGPITTATCSSPTRRTTGCGSSPPWPGSGCRWPIRTWNSRAAGVG